MEDEGSDLGAKTVHMNLAKTVAVPSRKRKPLPASVFTTESCNDDNFKLSEDPSSSDGGDNDNDNDNDNRVQNVDYEDFDLSKVASCNTPSSSSSSSSSAQQGDQPYSEVLRYLTFSNPYVGQTQIQGEAQILSHYNLYTQLFHAHSYMLLLNLLHFLDDI